MQNQIKLSTACQHFSRLNSQKSIECRKVVFTKHITIYKLCSLISEGLHQLKQWKQETEMLIVYEYHHFQAIICAQTSPMINSSVVRYFDCINVTGYQIASLGFSHCEIQGFYRAGKFNYFLSNNATVESRMLHQHLT